MSTDGGSDGLPKRGLCVLRPYRRADQMAVSSIMEQAGMETVSEFFWDALLSEIFPQLAFVAIAIGFVGLGLPVYFCLSLVPMAVFFMYFAIWSAHKIKVSELHGDIYNIPLTYQDDPRTGFWVAEVHAATESSELAAHLNITNKVLYEFITEEALDARGDNLANYRQHSVVGCVALTHSTHTISRSWLRRFAVASDYRRRGIATQLLQLAISFSRAKEFKGVELLTTQCHHQARAMYHKEGFEVTMNSRHFMNVSQSMYLFTLEFSVDKKRNDNSLTDSVHDMSAAVAPQNDDKKDK